MVLNIKWKGKFESEDQLTQGSVLPDGVAVLKEDRSQHYDAVDVSEAVSEKKHMRACSDSKRLVDFSTNFC